MKTFEVIKEDEQHFQIYDPVKKRIVTTLGVEADALSLKTAMDSGDINTIENLFFLSAGMRADALAAMAD